MAHVNPIVIAGMLVIAVFSAAMMMTLSGEQARYSRTVEITSEVQSQRIHEELDADLRGDNILVENTGPVDLRIKEIRIIDPDGQMRYMQKIDLDLSAAQSHTIALDIEAHQILAQYESEASP